MGKTTISPKVRNNWLVDAILFISALTVLLTSIYFFILPVGGYMGGRNPNYGLVFIMERSGWEFIHNWGGLLMIIVALIHFIIHWRWIKQTTLRVVNVVFLKADRFGSRLAWNIILDVIIAASFLVCAVSGLFFFLGGKYSANPFLFSVLTWDLIHNWSGVVMVMAAILHFTLHWKWIVNVTSKFFATRKVIKAEVPASNPIDPVSDAS